MNGIVSEYAQGGHYLILNPNLLYRKNFDLLLKLFQDSLILSNLNRMFMLNFNFINKYSKSIVKFDIIIEFSITGAIYFEFFCNVN